MVNSGYTKEMRLSTHHRCRRTRPMVSGCLVPETARSSVSV